MSCMKCPICGKQMKIGTLDQDDSMGTVWMSIMPCDCVCSYGVSKAVWQELIRTRKALDIAVQGIKTLGEYDPYKELQSIDTIAQNILDEIKTALEQKDVK